MGKKFLELKTTDNATIIVRKEAVAVLEESPASSRVEGHVKLFVVGFKFAVEGTSKEIVSQLEQD